MNLGSLATIGRTQPRNLVLLVIDNCANVATGSQPSMTSGRLDLDRIGAACGIERSVTIHERDKISPATRAALDEDGPRLIVIKTAVGIGEGLSVPEDGAAYLRSVAGGAVTVTLDPRNADECKPEARVLFRCHTCGRNPARTNSACHYCSPSHLAIHLTQLNPAKLKTSRIHG